jgi:hypothetical protein
MRELFVRSTRIVSPNPGGVKRMGRVSNVALTFVVLPLVDVFKVIDPCVVVILPRENDVVDVARMGVRNGVACLVS